MPNFEPIRILAPGASDPPAAVPPRGSSLARRAAAGVPLVLWALALVVSPVSAAGTKSARERGGPSGAEARKALAPAVTPVDGERTPRHPSEDLQFWLAEKTRTHRPSLPLEARLCYRRGLIARESGAIDEAARLVRGSSELDPMFAAPHLTLSSWLLFREPGQALLHFGAFIEQTRKSFILQYELSASILTLLIQSLFIGFLLAGFVIVLLRNSELRHGGQEMLSRWLGPSFAHVWPWGFLIVPFVSGIGFAIPTALFLGMLWPVLKGRERSVFIGLVALLLVAPWVAIQFDRFAAPLRSNEAPFYGTQTLEMEPYSPARREEIGALVAEHPESGFVQFGWGWMSRLAGDYGTAETAYRAAREIWPENDRVLNNLGNILVHQGKAAEGLEVYRQAIQHNPQNAEVHFNLAQLHTGRFEFQQARDALSRASALDFDMVRSLQALVTDDGQLPRVDQWLSPRGFWISLLAAKPQGHTFPVAAIWQGRLETSGWPAAGAGAAAAALGIVLGLLLHRARPMRYCSNCERVVCRRCAQRRRELALCASCATVESRASAPEFSRVLLQDHCRKLQRPWRFARTVVAVLLPGVGLMALRRSWAGLAFLSATAFLLSVTFGRGWAYAFEVAHGLSDRQLPLPLLASAWILLYVLSITSFLDELTRQDARQASQVRTPRQRPSVPRHFIDAAA